MRPAHIKEQREKEIRRIHKRQRAIWEEQRQLGYRKLEKPVRHGWYKEIVLTRKIERYKNQPHIEEVFNKLERSFWGRTKGECEKKWNDQVSKHMIVRDMPSLSKKQYNKLSDKAKRLCTPYQFIENRKRKVRYYVRLPKPAYQIKFTRAYITHSKIIDPLLESEEVLLEQQLEKHGYYNPNTRFWNWCKWDNWEIRDTRLQRKAFRQVLRVYRNVSCGSVTDELWERNLKGKTL